MRSWARCDEESRKIVLAADELRQKLIKEVLLAKGNGEEAASNKAELFGAAWLGSQKIENTDHRFKLFEVITQETDSKS